MRQFRTLGSVRGAPGNRRPYRDAHSLNEVKSHIQNGKRNLRISLTAGQDWRGPRAPALIAEG